LLAYHGVAIRVIINLSLPVIVFEFETMIGMAGAGNATTQMVTMAGDLAMMGAAAIGIGTAGAPHPTVEESSLRNAATVACLVTRKLRAQGCSAICVTSRVITRTTVESLACSSSTKNQETVLRETDAAAGKGQGMALRETVAGAGIASGNMGEARRVRSLGAPNGLGTTTRIVCLLYSAV
jgi:ABC-type uncharacterized transport system ATPase component